MTDYAACSYPAHRSSDWQLSPDHPVRCGICTPPALPGLAQPVSRSTALSSPPRQSDDHGALQLVEQGERALELVGSAEDAEVLWRAEDAKVLWRQLSAIEYVARLARVHGKIQLRAGRLKLRAERRWGELLGPAENHDPATVTAGHGSTGADRKARERARQVAEVPELVFERYIETARDAETLRRTRLLRAGREAEQRAKSNGRAPAEAVNARWATSSGAAEIRAEHEAYERDMRSARGHAERAGELLLELNARVPGREWRDWLKRERIPKRAAQRYMDFASREGPPSPELCQCVRPLISPGDACVHCGRARRA